MRPDVAAVRGAFQALRRTPWRGLVARQRGPNDRGHTVDPDVALMLWFDGFGARSDWHRRPVAEARRSFEVTTALIEGPAQPLAEVRDLRVAGRPARLYVPSGAQRHGRLLVFFHGGGWVIGSLRSHERLCMALAAEGGQRVLAVDYRLAPEHPYPEPLDDAVAAFRWAREHAVELGAAPDAIAIGGDSAGGNLSAAVCLVQRDEGRPQPAFQLLIYPATDFRRVTDSHRAFEEGYVLTRASLDWYQGHYAPVIYDPYCSPLLARSHRGLAPAIVVNAGFDPLRDDGELYAEALRAAGGRVLRLDYARQVHGFLSITGVSPAAAAALGEVARACADHYPAASRYT